MAQKTLITNKNYKYAKRSESSPLIYICLKKGEPKVGIEPTTYSLRMNCSTPELLRLKFKSKENDTSFMYRPVNSQ